MMTPFVRNVALIAAFAAGWIASGWQSASMEVVAIKAARAATQDAEKASLRQAEILDKTLSRLKANERTIIKENVKLVDRPVYRNICIDDDGMRNANAAKNGGTVEPSEGVQNP